MGQKYFTSDFHFRDGLVRYDRKEFVSEEAHATQLIETIGQWADKLNKDKTNEIWILGDFGNTDFLWVMDAFECKKVFVYGNHDKESDYDTFKLYFDEVYKYPVWLSDRILVSHYPLAVWDSQINIHGHLHGMIIDAPQYISCNVGDNYWELIPERMIFNRFTHVNKFSMKFLWEPYADTLPQCVLDKFSPREDIVYNPWTKTIDISASRALKNICAKN